MRSTHRFTAVALSSVALAGLAACGGSSTTAPPPSSSHHSSTAQKPGGSSSPTSTGPGSGTTKPATSHATEFNPPGDIPDTQVYVKFSVPNSHVVLRVPEGWARSSRSGTTTFTDKLNTVSVKDVTAAKAPTISSARTNEVPALAAAVSKFKLGSVTTTTRAGGSAVLIAYQQDSPPDPVTNKVVRDAVERFEFWHQGHEAILTLSGPINADNVDPWRTISDSLGWK